MNTCFVLSFSFKTKRLCTYIMSNSARYNVNTFGIISLDTNKYISMTIGDKYMLTNTNVTVNCNINVMVILYVEQTLFLRTRRKAILFSYEPVHTQPGI